MGSYRTLERERRACHKPPQFTVCIAARSQAIRTMEKILRKVYYHPQRGVPVRGLLFDMDGTITVPAIDFNGLRTKIGIPRPLDILRELEKMDTKKRAWTLNVIEEFEAEGRAKFALQPGAIELFKFLDQKSLPKGILTRNSRGAIDHMVSATGFRFDVELSRDFVPVKPAPDGALHFCQRVELQPHHCMMIGDSEDDMECGRRAGMVTVFLDDGNTRLDESWVDIRIRSLHELIDLLNEGFHVHRPDEL